MFSQMYQPYIANTYYNAQQNQRSNLTYGGLAELIKSYLSKSIVADNKPEVKQAIISILNCLGFIFKDGMLVFNENLMADDQLSFLREAMLGIQALRFKPILVKEQSFAWGLNPKALITTPSFNNNSNVYLTLPINSKKVFMEIYDLLRSYFYTKFECNWVFSYPKSIKNDAELNRWLHSFTETRTNKDFLGRGYTIDKHSFTTNDELDKTLKDYSQLATGYHCANDKAVVAEWIKKYGGQSTNSFISLLSMQGHFTDDDYYFRMHDTKGNLIGPGPAVGQAKNVNADWYLNEDHKWELDLQVDVLSFSYQEGPKVGTILLFNPLTQQMESLNQEECGNLLTELKKKNIEFDDALLRIHTKLELNIENGKVVPAFKDILVMSNTNKLLSPSRLDNNLAYEVAPPEPAVTNFRIIK